MAATLKPKINKEAFSTKAPKKGDTKTEDGVKFVYGPAGWKRINKRLAEQESKKKEKKVASTAARKTIKALKQDKGKIVDRSRNTAYG
jgi:hypothetical protein